MTIVGGFAIQVGWWTTIGASVSLLLLMACARLILNGPEVRHANGHYVARDRAQRLADWAVTGFAAVVHTKPARDLALEASELLDELAADGAGPWQLLGATVHFFLRAPGQLRARAKSPATTPNMRSLQEKYPLAQVGRLYAAGTFAPEVAFEIEGRDLRRVERSCQAAGIRVQATGLLGGRYGILLRVPRRSVDPELVFRTLREITPVGAVIVSRRMLRKNGIARARPSPLRIRRR